MSENNSNSGFAFIAGLLVGAAVGAIGGLLFAPESGEETRKKLAEKSKDFADDIYDRFDDLKETLTNALEDVKQGTTDVLEDVKKGTAEAIEDVKKTTAKK